MTYAVKESFYTLQGEGANAGRAAVFCRFAGCNLWSGREADRGAAVCRFCDTEFVGTEGDGGGKFGSAAELAAHIAAFWPKEESKEPQREGPEERLDKWPAERSDQWPDQRPGDRSARRFVVLTGGEPLLQVDDALIAALHGRGFEIAIETNGTLEAPAGIDWICVSPKAGAVWRQRAGQELKVVWPQSGLDLELLEGAAFTHRFLQPMDGAERDANTRLCIAQCLARPAWRLSLQSHKITGIR